MGYTYYTRKQRIRKTCVQCGKAYKVKPCVAPSSRCCSRQCKHAYQRSSSDALARFGTKYVVEQGGCWVWTGYRNAGGYARFTAVSTDGPMFAYRFAYEQRFGPVPSGLQLDHLCRNKACVNPEHLEPVTQAENIRRAAAAKRKAA